MLEHGQVTFYIWAVIDDAKNIKTHKFLNFFAQESAIVQLSYLGICNQNAHVKRKQQHILLVTTLFLIFCSVWKTSWENSLLLLFTQPIIYVHMHVLGNESLFKMFGLKVEVY